MSVQNLIKQFDSAGLELKVSDVPFARGVDAHLIFGMDIKRRVPNDARSEYFLCWPGAEDTIIHVAAVDKKIAQLVLTIKEQERQFVDEVSKAIVRVHLKKDGDDALKVMMRANRLRDRDIIEWNPDQALLRYRATASSRARHFLMGRDERQLFMCQLPKAASSVKAAHDSLKSPTVILAEGKQLGRTYRQGEWFFLNCTKDEQELLKKYLKSTLAVVHRKVNIGQFAGRRGGKPHTVDELIHLPAKRSENGFTVQQRDDVFVRGAVRHLDHETLKIGDWRKVILNNESQNATVAGGTWID